MNEIVKLCNDIYNIPLKKDEDDTMFRLKDLNAIEIKVFMAIVYHFIAEREANEQEITISLSDLKSLIGETRYSATNVLERMTNTAKRLSHLYIERTDREPNGKMKCYESISIFPYVRLDREGLTCSVNPKAEHMFTRMFLEKYGYSRFLLSMLYGLGKHEMLLAINLVRFRDGDLDDKGYRNWIVSADTLRETLAVPEKYGFKEIRRYILNPAIKKLRRFFTDLNYETIKDGRDVAAVRFTFKAVEDGLSGLRSPDEPPGYGEVEDELPF